MEWKGQNIPVITNQSNLFMVKVIVFFNLFSSHIFPELLLFLDDSILQLTWILLKNTALLKARMTMAVTEESPYLSQLLNHYVTTEQA